MNTVPHIVQQGDHLAALAAANGFDAETVWNDASNHPLHKAGRTPTMLREGDVLYIPEPKRKWLPVRTGKTNTFTAVVPTVDIHVQLMAARKPLANEPVMVRLGEPTPSKTDADGFLKLTVPARTKAVPVEIPRLKIVHTLMVGHLDPVSTTSGLRQRLQNLGHDAWGDSTASLASAIASFQATQKGLAVTGTLDDATRAVLAASHGC